MFVDVNDNDWGLYKCGLDNRFENTLHARYNFIYLNGIQSAVTFLELSISTFPGNSAYKMQVTGFGSGSLNYVSMRTFPWLGTLISSSPASLSGVRSNPNKLKSLMNISVVIMWARSSWWIPVPENNASEVLVAAKGEEQSLVSGSRVLNTVYIQHEICHITLMIMVRTCTCGTNECSVFNQSYKNYFWISTEGCIIHRDLMGPRTRIKVFNLSV